MGKRAKVLVAIALVAAISLWAVFAQAQTPPMTPQELAKYARGLKAELSLQQILNNLGYSYINVATDETGIELFPIIAGGYYEILYAEVAGYAPFTSSGWYPEGAPADTHIVFTGDNVPGDTALFNITDCDTFGLYMNPENQAFMWYTEQSLNSDNWDHAWIFHTNDPRQFIVAWEDQPQSQSDADYQDLVVLFRQPNQPPVITCPGAQTVDENQLLSFPISATDADGDTVTLWGENLPSGSSFPTVVDSGSVSGTFNWTPDFCQAGTYTVRFIATDNYLPSLADTGYVTITVNPPPFHTIYEIQFTTDPSGDSPYKSSEVVTAGIVTAAPGIYSSSYYYIQDGSGAWNGIKVYDSGKSYSEGDSLTVTGEVKEYYNETEIIADCVILNSSGNSLPAAFDVSTSAVDTSEAYEGVLIKVSDAVVANPNLGYGEWQVDDCSGPCRVNDRASYSYSPVVYDGLNVTGIVFYTYGDYKMEPRYDADIQLLFSFHSIYDIQYTTDPSGNSPYKDSTVVTAGIVTAAPGIYSSSYYYIQDGSGPWNGIKVYHKYQTFAEGDSLIVIGKVKEYYNETEIMASCAFLESSGNPLPAVADVPTNTVNTSEDYEGVLVKVSDVVVTNPNLDYGEWEVDDGSGSCRVNNAASYSYSPVLNNCLNVAGIVFYTYSNYKIEPRYDADIEELQYYPVVSVSDTTPAVDEGQLLSFPVTGIDPCPGDTANLSAVGLPSGATFTGGRGNPAGGTFNWTPNYGQAGIYPVLFIATDEGSPVLADTVEVTITVNDVNQGPQITDPGPQEVYEGEFLTFTVTGWDPDTLDGDDVILSAVNLPEGSSFPPDTGNPVTVVFEWTPNFGQGAKPDSVYTVTFIAEDIHKKLQATVDVLITVHDVNRPPQLTDPGTQEVCVGDTVTFTITGADPDTLDGDLVVLSVKNLPAGASFSDGTGNPVTGTFQWVPGPQVGDSVYTLLFIGTDTHWSPLADTVEVKITVHGYEISLGDTISAWPGSDIDVPIYLSNNCYCVGGYDILLHYDPSVLTLTGVDDSLNWEYFNWTSWQVDDGQKLRIIGIANKPNQIYTEPLCYPMDTLIALLHFHISAKWDPNYQTPIDFEVDNPCVDNTISNGSGTKLWTPWRRYYWMGTDYRYEQVEACEGVPGTIALKGTKVQGVDIQGPYGDVNGDGIDFTIADAVYFMEYLKGVVDLTDPTYQGTASDINLDGHQWTIADLIYLVNIVNGSAQRPGESGAKAGVQGLNLTVKGNTVSVDKPIAGLYLRIKGGGEPNLRASGMEMETEVVNGERRIIIIGANWQNETATAVGELVTIPGDFQIKEVQVSDAGGWLMATKLVLIPTQFALHQNYPNPFNPETKISFDLPEDVNVSLTVYNISGQKIADLVNGEVKAGKHTVNWNATDVSSGVYFYRLTAGSFTATKKMVLMK